MKFPRLLLPSVILLLAISACKNDLNLNAPYREMPSIYAVISGQEKIHTIRVNKIFLGEGDANVMAKVADSVNYGPGELTITLDRYESGSGYKKQINACPTCSDDPSTPINEKQTVVFRDSVVQANPNGAFSTTQRIYVSSADLHEGPVILNSSGVNINTNWKVFGDYILTVKNNKTGNVFRAKSTAVDSIRPGFKPLNSPYYPYPAGWNVEDDFIDYSVQDKSYSVRFNFNDAQVYQLVVRLHFYDSLSPFNINRYMDYVGNNLDLSRDKRTGVGGSSYLQQDFKGRDVFNAASAMLKKLGLTNDVFGRKVYMVEYLVYSSTQDYADYLEFVKPSLNIAQEKPLYSNFENRSALGIFTFRSRFSVKKMPSRTFISSFAYEPGTCGYLFFTADLSRKGCQ